MVVAVFADIVQVLGESVSWQYNSYGKSYIVFSTCTYTLSPVSSRSFVPLLLSLANLLRIDCPLQVGEVRVWVYSAEEYGFELVHAGIGKQEGRI